MSTRVPCDPDYTTAVGTADYAFAYYKGAVIYIIEQLRPGFLGRYSRGAPMTSGGVLKELEAILGDSSVVYNATTATEMRATHDRFADLITKRNALIHAHPITNNDG